MVKGSEAKLVRHNLKVAWRNLLKYKLQTVISIVGLAVGLSCFVVCNNGLLDELRHNKRMPYADETYVLGSVDPKGEINSSANAKLAKVLRDEFPEVMKAVFYFNITGYTDKVCVVDHENGTKTFQKEFFLYTDSSFMDFYDFKLLQGNRETVNKQPDAVVLTSSAAVRLFGTTDVVGRTFTDVNDFNATEQEYIVAGVMEDFPVLTDFEGNAGLVLNTTDKNFREEWFSEVADVYVRLQSGISYEAVNQKITSYVKQRPELKDRYNRPFQLYPFGEERNNERHNRQMTIYLIFSGIGLLVLLAAMFNYALFMLGRVLNRQKEYGIRQMSGAGFRSLFIMFGVEITLSIGLSVLFSMLLLELLIPFLSDEKSFMALLSSSRNWLLWLGKQLIVYAFVVWGIMVCVCWFVLKRIKSMSLLRNLQEGGTSRRTTVQNLLLGLQLVICMLFAGGAYFLYAQQDYIQQKMIGGMSREECQRIYTFPLNGDKLEPIREEFKNMVHSNPDISESCRTHSSLLQSWTIAPEKWHMSEIKEEAKGRLSYIDTDPNYVSFIHARMVEGRYFNTDEPLCAVVNQEFVTHYGVNPLGKEISLSYFAGVQNYRIVGIMENIMPTNDHSEVTPCIFLMYSETSLNQNYHVKLKRGADPKVLEPLRAKMQEQVNIFTPLWINTLDEEIKNSVGLIRELGMLIFLLSLICILICLLGIYSSMMLAVEKRSREMAIRKINGATLQDIAKIFGLHYLWLLGGAAVVAFPILYYCVKIWLENLKDHITITVFPFIVLWVVMVFIILITIGSQLMKLIRINPARVLKDD